MKMPVSDVIRNIPIYKKLYEGKDIAPELNKENVSRDFPFNFMTDSLATAIKEGTVEYTATSGTTSDRMQIVRKAGWWKEEYVRTSLHNNFLNEFYQKKDARKIILTTAICSGTVCHLKEATYEERIVNNTLYLNSSPSPFSWSSKDIIRMVKEIDDFQPEYIDADPYYFANFLMKIQEFNLDLPKHRPDFITLSYEFVPVNCREYIENTMKVPVFNLYGSTETGYITCECERGNLHLIEDLAEYGFVLIGRGVYSLRVTSLKNQYMPLVNYKIGDLVTLRSLPLENCPCGAKGQILVESLQGREKDAFILDASHFLTVGDMDCLMKQIPSIYLYQLDVSCFPKLGLKYCKLNKASKISDENVGKILKGLKGILGEHVFLEIKEVPEILPEISGKFRLIVR